MASDILRQLALHRDKLGQLTIVLLQAIRVTFHWLLNIIPKVLRQTMLWLLQVQETIIHFRLPWRCYEQLRQRTKPPAFL